MLTSDAFALLQWWVTIFILGTGFLPLAFLIFGKFFDRGYIFSKLLAISFTSYAIFLLGVLRIVPFTQISSLMIFLVLTIAIFFGAKKHLDIIDIFKKNWKIFIFEEIIFFIALASWSYIHGFNPDIHGLEKYMDFGFINSILRSDYFPPKDMWFTPNPINYYYFGHIATAVLTKLSNLPSYLTFNLMLSSIFAFCFVETLSLGANLFNLTNTKSKFLGTKRIIAGLLTGILVTFAGNLHILYSFFKSYQTDSPVPFWQLPFLPSSFPNSYWYPNATRFIYHTIHEFPIYSWVVADLHGHVLDIPFVLLTIATLLSIFISKPETRNQTSPTDRQEHEANSNQQKTKHKHALYYSKLKHLYFIGNWKLLASRRSGEIGNLLLIGFMLAIMYMTNAWDGGIYLLLTTMVIFYSNREDFFAFLKSIAIICISFAIFTIPYSIFFKPFASGIGILCAPPFLLKIGKIGPLLFEANHCQHSYWWQILILYGFFYFFVICFGVFVWRAKKLLKTDIFVCCLIILSTFLIILPEFIYLKDIYPAHFRANTMFKLVFQSFIMLSICCGYIVTRLISALKNMLFAFCFLLFATILISLVLTYPYLATKSYYNDLKIYKGLNGISYLKDLYPTDFEAIQWLNKNISGQPVILEAQGDSYTDYGRISVNTGLPTVLGWTVHEWLWRGDYSIPAPRITDIQTLYETKNLQKTKKLLNKYAIKYVFIGSLEYQKYPSLSGEKFEKIGKVVFEKKQTKIFKISF